MSGWVVRWGGWVGDKISPDPSNLRTTFFVEVHFRVNLQLVTWWMVELFETYLFEIFWAARVAKSFPGIFHKLTKYFYPRNIFLVNFLPTGSCSLSGRRLAHTQGLYGAYLRNVRQ